MARRHPTPWGRPSWVKCPGQGEVVEPEGGVGGPCRQAFVVFECLPLHAYFAQKSELHCCSELV